MNEQTSKLFPRDLYGRIALGIASLVLAPVGAAMFVALLTRPRPRGVTEWLVVAVASELSLALAIFFVCGLVWAVATPKWLEASLERVARRLTVALFLFMVPFTA